jgi:hypothetical protein
MSNLTPRPNAPSSTGLGSKGAVISETRVKQGRRGTRTLVILAVSTALAAVLVLGIFAFTGLAPHSASGGEEQASPQAARSFNAPMSQPKPGLPAQH